MTLVVDVFDPEVEGLIDLDCIGVRVCTEVHVVDDVAELLAVFDDETVTE